MNKKRRFIISKNRIIHYKKCCLFKQGDVNMLLHLASIETYSVKRFFRSGSLSSVDYMIDDTKNSIVLPSIAIETYNPKANPLIPPHLKRMKKDTLKFYINDMLKTIKGND